MELLLLPSDVHEEFICIVSVFVLLLLSVRTEKLTTEHWLIQDWDQQTTPQIITELCGFVTILAGTFLLHATKDMGDTTAGLSSYTTPGKHSPHIHHTVTQSSGICT